METTNFLEQFEAMELNELQTLAKTSTRSKETIAEINNQPNEVKMEIYKKLLVNKAILKPANKGETVQFYLFKGGNPATNPPVSVELKKGMLFEVLKQGTIYRSTIEGFEVTGSNDFLEVEINGETVKEKFSGISVIGGSSEVNRVSVNSIKLIEQPTKPTETETETTTKPKKK